MGSSDVRSWNAMICKKKKGKIIAKWDEFEFRCKYLQRWRFLQLSVLLCFPVQPVYPQGWTRCWPQPSWGGPPSPGRGTSPGSSWTPCPRGRCKASWSLMASRPPYHRRVMGLMGSENILPQMHANTFEGHWKIVQIDAKTEKQWTWVDELCWTALQAKNRQRQLKPADQGASWESRNLSEFYVVKPSIGNRCKNTYDKVPQKCV